VPPPPRYLIEQLDRRHERGSFSCGRPELDGYLRERAIQDIKRKTAAVFVAVPEGSANLVGYYALSSTSVRLAGLPEQVARKLPRYPDVPATLLGRLAVDTRHQAKGIGAFLQIDALHRALRTSADVASFAVVVDAIDEDARAFYEHFEFIQFPDLRLRLFLPMESVARLF
jgi:GNAT superfamily N-acetyltransferase